MPLVAAFEQKSLSDIINYENLTSFTDFTNRITIMQQFLLIWIDSILINLCRRKPVFYVRLSVHTCVFASCVNADMPHNF